MNVQGDSPLQHCPEQSVGPAFCGIVILVAGDLAQSRSVELRSLERLVIIEQQLRIKIGHGRDFVLDGAEVLLNDEDQARN